LGDTALFFLGDSSDGLININYGVLYQRPHQSALAVDKLRWPIKGEIIGLVGRAVKELVNVVHHSSS